jgi:hypothetical protein
MAVRTLIAGLLGITAVACSQAENRAAPSTGNVVAPVAPSALETALPSKARPMQGRVLDYPTYVPRSGMTVRFAGQELSDVTTATDAGGYYRLSVPGGFFDLYLNDRYSGRVRTIGPPLRGDVFFETASCASRYGVISDRRTWRTVEGATVSLLGITTTTDVDGWYRIDVGCPSPLPTDGTIAITVTHPRYMTRSQIVGRGIDRVYRLDLDLIGRVG